MHISMSQVYMLNEPFKNSHYGIEQKIVENQKPSQNKLSATKSFLATNWRQSISPGP